MLEDQGKRPKSADSIRASLQSIQASQKDDTSAGPLAKGLEPMDQLVVQSFKNYDVGRQFQQRLMDNGVMTTGKRHRGEYQVMVDYEDRDAASAILREHMKSNPDVLPIGYNCRYDFLIFGLIIGLTLGVLLVLDVYNASEDMLIAVSFAICGAVCGHLVDRVILQVRRTNQLQIGMREFLLTATLPALIIAVSRIVSLLVSR